MDNISFVIVDDALFMRNLLRKVIEEVENYIVVGEGSNGYDAIKLAESLKPDIMTLDITMPDMDGIKAVGEVLKISPNTKILMISAMGQQNLVLESIKLGARGFVIKPFEKENVKNAIKKIV
jgi:two-component system chemotaxis response regulator CheY